MNILIIGCGYIGTEVAKIWRKAGYTVTATTRNPERLEELSQVAHKSVIIKGDNEEELIPLIKNNDVILVSIAADTPKHYESAYLNTAQTFRRLALELDLPRQLIYTSTTTVYGDHHGRWVDENSPLLAESEQGKILIDAEKTFLSLQEIGWQVCVLRISEIYGPTRELSNRFLRHKEHILPGCGERFTNMAHKNDIVSAIDYALRHKLEGIYNISDDEHPTRKQLYDILSQKLQLPPVKWDPTHTPLHSGNKRVSNHKIKSEGFAFQHPSRILD
jgi:nucleoside-diphosphate-sugar epimerase